MKVRKEPDNEFLMKEAIRLTKRIRKQGRRPWPFSHYDRNLRIRSATANDPGLIFWRQMDTHFLEIDEDNSPAGHTDRPRYFP